jgi:hypothetical protein
MDRETFQPMQRIYCNDERFCRRGALGSTAFKPFGCIGLSAGRAELVPVNQ